MWSYRKVLSKYGNNIDRATDYLMSVPMENDLRELGDGS
jgi:hypothetical protein